MLSVPSRTANCQQYDHSLRELTTPPQRMTEPLCPRTHPHPRQRKKVWPTGENCVMTSSKVTSIRNYTCKKIIPSISETKLAKQAGQTS